MCFYTCASEDLIITNNCQMKYNYSCYFAKILIHILGIIFSWICTIYKFILALIFFSKIESPINSLFAMFLTK